MSSSCAVATCWSCGVGPGCKETSVMRPMSSDLLAHTPRNLPTVARVSSGPLAEAPVSPTLA